MSLNPLAYQPHSNVQQGAAMFTASWVQLRLELLVCGKSVLVNVITHTFVGLKCLTETKIQILCDHVDHTRFHIVEMGCQMVQLLSAHIVGPTMFVNLTPALLMVCLHPIGHLRPYWWHAYSILMVSLICNVHPSTHWWYASFVLHTIYRIAYSPLYCI